MEKQLWKPFQLFKCVNIVCLIVSTFFKVQQSNRSKITESSTDCSTSTPRFVLCHSTRIVGGGSPRRQERHIYSFKLSENVKHSELKCTCNVDNNSEINLNSELITKKYVKGNDKKVLYMTGLPSYMILIAD